MSKSRTSPKDSTPKIVIEDTLNRVDDDTLIYTRVVTKSDSVNEEIYTLAKIAREDLKQKRKNGKAGLIFKINNDLYFTEIPATLHVFTFTCGRHHCADCAHLSALQDEDGGCRKVRDSKKCIENYDFIPFGYETYNTCFDVFVVLACTRFEKIKPRTAVMSFSEVNSLKRSLQDFYEDADFGKF